MGGRRLGAVLLKRGEIQWYSFQAPDKRRPVLILTRVHLIDHLNGVIVVPVTRTIRGIQTEVILTPDDGMPTACALSFDNMAHAQRDRIGSLIAIVPESKWDDHVTGGLQALPPPLTTAQIFSRLNPAKH